jgi:hypothetical protein
MTTTLTLGPDLYTDFIRCLTNLKEVCNDIEIRDGILRQRSNDRTSIFELDMTPVIPNVTMGVTDIKGKLDNLKMFSGQQVTLNIYPGEGQYYSFNDAYTKYRILTPSLEYLDNKFMTAEELDRMFVMNDEDLILETDLPLMITDRIRIMTTSFHTESIQILFEGESATIKTATQAKDQFGDFMENITKYVLFSS